jgi:hypothetical protein
MAARRAGTTRKPARCAWPWTPSSRHPSRATTASSSSSTPTARLQPVDLPAPPAGLRWHRVIDTSLSEGQDVVEPGREVPLSPADRYLVNPRSTVVLLAAG